MKRILVLSILAVQICMDRVEILDLRNNKQPVEGRRAEILESQSCGRCGQIWLQFPKIKNITQDVGLLKMLGLEPTKLIFIRRIIIKNMDYLSLFLSRTYTPSYTDTPYCPNSNIHWRINNRMQYISQL